MAFDDMFLPELVGGGEFPSGDLLFGGFGSLLQDSRASTSLQELSACYFPNAQAEMWAAADVKPPAADLCPSLT
jgi:myb proto-oncogene protein